MSISAIAILAAIALARTSIVGPVQHALAAIDADSLGTLISLAAVAGSAVAGWAGAKRGNKGTERQVKKLMDEYISTQAEVRGLRAELKEVKRQRNQLRAQNEALAKDNGELRAQAAENAQKLLEMESKIGELMRQIQELEKKTG